jgi:hypothetical protein
LLGWIGQTCVGWIGEKRRVVICIISYSSTLWSVFDHDLFKWSTLMFWNRYRFELWWDGVMVILSGGVPCSAFAASESASAAKKPSPVTMGIIWHHPKEVFFSTNKSRLGIFYYWIFVELSWIKCSSRRARHLIQLRILLPPRKGSGVFHCPPKQLVLEICTGCMFLGSCSRNSNQKVEEIHHLFAQGIRLRCRRVEFKQDLLSVSDFTLQLIYLSMAIHFMEIWRVRIP